MVVLKALLIVLFPAWAGVIPAGIARRRDYTTFPRMGGGDPGMCIMAQLDESFSPHGRG